jgi:hydrogenase/urease accessory protein HupE
LSRRLALVALCVVLPLRAEAHLNSTGMGPLYDGVMHFATSPGDVLPALALALFAGLRGAEHGRRALFALPLAWLFGALVGAAAPLVADNAIASAVWLIALGGLLALDLKLTPRGVTVLAACVGLYHGFLNGAGLGWSASSLSALLGLVAAVFALAALGSALVVALRVDWGRIAVRVAGSWIAASGMLWLGWAARPGS